MNIFFFLNEGFDDFFFFFFIFRIYYLLKLLILVQENKYKHNTKYIHIHILRMNESHYDLIAPSPKNVLSNKGQFVPGVNSMTREIIEQRKNQTLFEFLSEQMKTNLAAYSGFDINNNTINNNDPEVIKFNSILYQNNVNNKKIKNFAKEKIQTINSIKKLIGELENQGHNPLTPTIPTTATISNNRSKSRRRSKSSNSIKYVKTVKKDKKSGYGSDSSMLFVFDIWL